MARRFRLGDWRLNTIIDKGHNFADRAHVAVGVTCQSTQKPLAFPQLLKWSDLLCTIQTGRGKNPEPIGM
jgi:hypothetical protein